MKANAPGQLIQIDHMVVSKNQLTLRHFQAWDPVTKSLVAELYSNANAAVAQKFLLKGINGLPFKVQSIQVDGESEFRANFAVECQQQGIKLLVLPPQHPQYNGGVERANRTLREEFYSDPQLSADSLGEMRPVLAKAIDKYNNYRSHLALGGLTPSAYTSAYLSRSL